MGLIGLTREVLSIPLTLAKPAAGLVYDVARSVVADLRTTDNHLDRTGTDLPHRRRRIWERPGRAHIELREVPDEWAVPYLATIAESLGGVPGVSEVRLHPGCGRVVVDFDHTTTSDAVVGVLESAERDVGADRFGFGRHRPDHPADREPTVEGIVSIGADVAGLALASVGRALRIPALPFEVDAAALLTVASYVPWARSYIERHTDSPALGTGLTVARAVAGGLTQSFGGPMVDIVHRSSGVAAATARRRSWDRLEPELVEWHPGDWEGRLVRPPRPGPLPDGPIERASRPMSLASSAAAGLGFLVRPNADRAISFLVAGTPKAARWGREAFSAHLSMYFADRDILVLDTGALERLDRIDTLVVAAELLVEGRHGELQPFAPELLAAARDAGVEVWAATDRPASVERLEVKGTVPWAAADAVRQMQSEGRGVAVLAGGRHPALPIADVSLALRVPDQPISWEASFIGGTDLVDGLLLMMSIATAKVTSRQSAHVALAGTGVAGLMAFGGVIPGNLNRVIGAINLASLVSHANGARLAGGLAQRSLPDPPDRRPFHAMDIEEVLTLLESGVTGLGPDEVAERTLPRRPPVPTGLLLARAVSDELVNPLTPFLAAGAGLSAAAGSASDAVLVGGVVGLNAAIGGVQRFRADRATAALLQTQTTRVKVIRSAEQVTIPSDELVTGDIVALHAGDVVPADCRIIEDLALEVDESTLTGESIPVPKSGGPCDVLTPVADRHSMLFAGTSVAAGSTLAIVTATGRHTEAYHGLLLVGRGPSETGVEARLESLTTMVTPVSVLAGLGVLGSGVARGLPVTDVLSAGVSLAVAAVPEGLPLLATAAQQSAARRLSKRGVIVRNSRAIEALGRIDTLCADKTGTLTLGKIRVHLVSDGEVDEAPEGLSGWRRRVLAAARSATPDSRNGERLPHPTDRAVLYAAETANLHRHEELGDWAAIAEIPFEPSRGYHAVVGTTGRGRLLCVKGAPEVVLARCTHHVDAAGRTITVSNTRRRAWQDHIEGLAGAGLRILVVAERSLPADTPLDEQQVFDLTFLGFLALKDPIRETARQAVDDLTAAGVRVIMITGDHPVTAAGIAAELGLHGEDCLTGGEIDQMTDTDLGTRLVEVGVCARVTPAHKVRIVRALQQRGHVVAMTGDGANDAPAIRLAEVGIALGTRATDAARDASDLIVTDDRIETIVTAVVEGRALWASVRDATAILVGGNLGEIAFTLAGSLLTGAPPINTRQLLLVNLMTDVLPAMAIAVSTPPNVSPRSLLAEGPDASLGHALNRAIIERAIVTTLGTAGGWTAARLTGRRTRANTVALASLVATELGQTLLTGWRSPLVVASGLGSMAALVGVVQTPGLSQLFGCTPLGPLAWGQALTSAGVATLGSFVVTPLVERMMPVR